MSKKKTLIVGLIILAVTTSIVLADVIYVYTGTVTAKPLTTPPLVFSTGPNAYPSSPSASSFVDFYGSSTGFTVTIWLPDSSGAYFYQAGILQVNTPGYLYVNNVVPNISGTALINNLIIYITSQSSGTQCEFQILSGGLVSSVLSNICTLTPGTYYINIYASPNTPVSSAGPETVTINFGYNVIGNEAVSVPS